MAFHWCDGWMFERRVDGAVRFWNVECNVDCLIQPNEWKSIVASMSAEHGDDIEPEPLSAEDREKFAAMLERTAQRIRRESQPAAAK